MCQNAGWKIRRKTWCPSPACCVAAVLADQMPPAYQGDASDPSAAAKADLGKCWWW